MVGTLLPFSSLVSKKYPHDKMAAARLFIDWLAATGQTVWQMLPISGSTDGLSPYASVGFGVDPNLGTLEDFIELRKYAHKKKVELWGDVPYYLPANSPLVAKYPQYFDFSGIAGSLGDKHFGKRQIWGFPLYAGQPWEVWQERIDFLAQVFDRIRFDAAIRFFRFEKLSFTNPKDDQILPGPGEEFFTRLVKYCRSQGLEPFVEDIAGLNMNQLYKACVELHVPTISVFTLILAPDSDIIDPTDFRLPFEKDHIYYTSTHDTPTLKTYLESLKPRQRAVIKEIFGDDVLAALKKKCPILMVPIQDWLKTSDRINIPDTTNKHNWHYKMTKPIEELPI